MKELRMLSAEDEQSRSCWMTAFRIFKVILRLKNIFNIVFNYTTPQHLQHSTTALLFTVWDCIVPELQDSTAKKSPAFTLLSTCGKLTSLVHKGH